MFTVACNITKAFISPLRYFFLVITLSVFSLPAFAAGTETAPIQINVGTVNASGAGYTFAANTITITENGWYTLSGSTTANRVVVAGNLTDVTITVGNGFSINRSADATGNESASAFRIGANSNVVLRYFGLPASNVLRSGANRAGLHVPSTARLTMYDFSQGLTSGMQIHGGARAAGIGGDDGAVGTQFAGIITINSGAITVSGGCAGIGGGTLTGGGGSITVNGGTVIASGNGNGAGIGGCDTAGGGNITITGGHVTANGSENGAGIGGGGSGNGGNIVIRGNATVIATGGTPPAGNIQRGGGAGIGGGGGNQARAPGASGVIAIVGNANVTANGGSARGANTGGGAGVGSGGLGSFGGANAVNANDIIITTNGAQNFFGAGPVGRVGAGVGSGGTATSGGTAIVPSVAVVNRNVTVTRIPQAGGVVSSPPSGNAASFTVPNRSNQSFTIRPNPGYVLRAVTATGKTGNAPVAHWTMTNITADASITATFALENAGVLQRVVSRKVHGDAGTFVPYDLPIDLNGSLTPGSAITVEPRSGGGNGVFEVVFQFEGTVNSASAALTGVGANNINATTTANGSNEVTVRLTNVSDGTRLGITLTVDGAANAASANIGFLSGKVGDGYVVNQTDVTGVRTHVGAALSEANFIYDLDVSGVINQSDVTSVRTAVGQVLQ